MSTADYEKFFDAVDKDKNGTLSFQELEAFLKKKGYGDSEIKTFFHNSDLSGDGVIEKHEFLEALGVAPPKVHKNAAIRTIFHGFDKDGNGYITRDELKEAWKDMKKVLTEPEVKKLMSWCDKDGDDKISYEELLEYYQKN